MEKVGASIKKACRADPNDPFCKGDPENQQIVAYCRDASPFNAFLQGPRNCTGYMLCRIAPGCYYYFGDEERSASLILTQNNVNPKVLSKQGKYLTTWFSTIEMRFMTFGLAITLGILVLIPSTNYVTAQGGNGNVTGAKFLFIQGAQFGSVSEVNATTSTLELSDVSDNTILFSDRPDRIVGSADTTDFIGNQSIGTNNFAMDPPNAVLILDDVEQREEVAVIELYNPEYDSQANT